MKPNIVLLYYKELRKNYVDPVASWSQKGTVMRTLLEGFFKDLTQSCGRITLDSRINMYFDSHPEFESLRATTHLVRRELNPPVHEGVVIGNNGVTYWTISEDKFRNYYGNIVNIIRLTTGVEPDDQTRELLGHRNSDILGELNAQQRDAATCGSRIVYVNAGPGTGKTNLLVGRMIHYIRNAGCNKHVVALSFTNTAAREIGTRFQQKAFGLLTGGNYDLFTGTIHSFCLKCMREYDALAGRRFSHTIIGDDEQLDLLDDVARGMGYRYSVDQLREFLQGRPDNPMPDEVKACMKQVRKSHGLLLLSDLMPMFLERLGSDASFLQWTAGRTDVILVDESQDLSEDNLRIFDILLDSKPSLSLFFVGDPRQNIFAFNGGSFRHLEAFLGRHGQDVERKDLCVTYRCPSSVVDFVNGMKFTDCKLPPLRPIDGNQGVVAVHEYADEADEARAIVEDALSGRLDQSVVIAPSVKGLEHVIDALNERNVPFRVYGGRRMQKPHVRLFNHFFRIMHSDNERSIKAVAKACDLDVISQPAGANRYHSPKELFYDTRLGRRLKRLSKDALSQGLSLRVVAERIISDFMPADSIKDEAGDELMYLALMAGGYPTVGDYLYAFSSDRERFMRFYNKSFNDCAVPVEDVFLTLSTIHSAKGLQWPCVYMIGMCEEKFPAVEGKRFRNDELRSEFVNTRLKQMYVACTRAQSRLEISYPLVYGNRPASPSSFIASLVSGESR